MSMEAEVAKLASAFEKHTYDDTTHFGEMKSALQNLESEAAEIKRIALETHEQAVKTNGSVASLQRTREQYTGGVKVAIPTLLIFMGCLGWLVVDYLDHRDKVPVDQIQAAVDKAFQENLTK